MKIKSIHITPLMFLFWVRNFVLNESVAWLKWTPTTVSVRPVCEDLDMDVKQLKALKTERICGVGTPVSFNILFALIMVYLTTLSVAQAVYCLMVAWVMNEEFKRMWKEVITICFKVLSWHSLRGTEVTHENPQSGSPVPRWRFASGTCLTHVERVTA